MRSVMTEKYFSILRRNTEIVLALLQQHGHPDFHQALFWFCAPSVSASWSVNGDRPTALFL